MYLNPYQEYIKELLCEYDSLLKRQLLKMINYKFNTQMDNIDGYVAQMCQFADYKVLAVGNDEAVCREGAEPDYDIIRSFDVLLAFIPKVQHHRKSRDFISIVFIIGTEEHDKEISVIPVKAGREQRVSSFSRDKFDAEKCELAIFLLDSKEQLNLIDTGCNHKFAIIDSSGVKFMKHNIPNI